jgi:hypothetical protein
VTRASVKINSEIFSCFVNISKFSNPLKKIGGKDFSLISKRRTSAPIQLLRNSRGIMAERKGDRQVFESLLAED